MNFQLIFLLVYVSGCQGWTFTSDTSAFSFHSRKVTSTTSLRSTKNDFNVVLRPSSDPKAFDSAKIGAARVHRYARDTDDGSEYVMWYHGRGVDFDADGKLPPLSTGRIGRATSRNGLIWKRNEIGSESEDYPGVSLGLNSESWWGFDTAHVGLGQVLLPMSTPAVMADGGVYLMYYMGGSFEETSIVQYLEKDIPGAEMAKIQGMNMKIGVALSQDGVTFGRVEGDDPSNAILAPYNESDPNMKYIKTMRDDDGSRLNIQEELYCAWPEVVVNDVPEDERTATMAQRNFYMFYSTMLKATKQKAIGVAVSDDGFKWMHRGIAIKPEQGTLDEDGCARCCVVRKAIHNQSTGAWVSQDDWIMYYEGVSKKDGKHRILAAESKDLRKWKKIGVAFDIGEDGSWDSHGVGAPHLIRLDDGSTRMYYTGQCADGNTAIGVAKCTDDMTSFVRERAEFTF